MSEYQKIEKNSLELVSEKNNKFLNIYLGLNQLKNTLRTGWLKYHGLKDKLYGESVAEHSFTSAALIYILAKELELDIDADKVMKMMLFHEMGEIKSGDLVSYKSRDIGEEEKFELEKKDIEEIFSGLKVKDEIIDLWMEFEKGDTPEAKLARSMDQLEAVFQAWVYQKNSLVNDSVAEFKEYAIKVVRENNSQEILEILESLEFN